MTYPGGATLDTVVADEQVLVAEERNAAVAAGFLPACARPPARSKGQRPRADYGEEAIPERDPAYRLPDGTAYETQTVEHLTPADRRALAHCLEQLGMGRARATILARL
jgi:hypothetical protein